MESQTITFSGAGNSNLVGRCFPYDPVANRFSVPRSGVLPVSDEPTLALIRNIDRLSTLSHAVGAIRTYGGYYGGGSGSCVALNSGEVVVTSARVKGTGTQSANVDFGCWRNGKAHFFPFIRFLRWNPFQSDDRDTWRLVAGVEMHADAAVYHNTNGLSTAINIPLVQEKVDVPMV